MSARDWLVEPERGSRLAMELLVYVSRLGRRPVHVFLWVACWYFLLFARRARRASRSYYARLGGHPGWLTTFRHFYRFAQASFDRVYFLSGRLDHFEIDRVGSQHIIELAEHKRGALLLGAHFGSFEAMRAVARSVQISINILAHGANARRIAAVLRRFGDETLRLRVIEIKRDDPDYILEVKRRIDEGELVAVLGDRVGINERSIRVPFLGGNARFPTGPYYLAHVLACPVLFVYGIFEAPNRYHLRCEPFADRVELPRGAREEEAARLCRRYVARLEMLCRETPDNWFNFYDCWEEGDETTTLASPAGAEARS